MIRLTYTVMTQTGHQRHLMMTLIFSQCMQAYLIWHKMKACLMKKKLPRLMKNKLPRLMKKKLPRLTMS